MKGKRICFGLVTMMLAMLIGDWALGQENVEVMVSHGDTLINICQAYLDEPDDWPQVADANPSIKNPDRIFPGQKLAIPARLLKGVPSRGKVSFLKGTVEMLKTEAREWVPVLPETLLSEGYHVRTGADSALEITFEDNSSILMKSNTCLKLLKTRHRGIFGIAGDLFLELGRVISHIRKATGHEPRFEIRTPSAIASVRGTDFRVSHDRLSSSRIEVLHGGVNAKGEKRRVPLNEGEGTLIEKGKEPEKPRKLLAAPALLKPEPLYRKLPLEFHTTTVPQAAAYRLVVAKDPEIRDIVQEVTRRPGKTVKMVNIDDGTYYLQTASIDEKGLEGVPRVVPFAVRVNPVPPFVQSPVAGEAYKTLAMTFSWLNVADAVGYQLQIADDPAFTQIVEERELKALSTYKTEKLKPKPYYFRILSIAADGYRGIYSDAVRFELVPPPPVPEAQPPVVGRKMITLQWQKCAEDSRYHFQMSSDKAFKEILMDETLDTPRITFKTPKKGGMYFVRVSTLNAEGFEGHFAPAQSFTIKKFPWGIVGGLTVTVGAFVGILVF